MTQFDPDGNGIVSKDDFIDTITGLQGPVEEEEMKRVRIWTILCWMWFYVFV